MFDYLQNMKNNKQNLNHFMIDAIEITKSWTLPFLNGNEFLRIQTQFEFKRTNYRIIKHSPIDNELTKLFGLITLYENGVWYLENGMITQDGMKKIFELIKIKIAIIAKNYENQNIFNIPEILLERIPMLNKKLYSKL